MEKKAAASEKTKALAEKRLADLEAKVGETKLKLAEAESLNTVRAEELADLRAALEGCESKWYNEGFADAENSVELVINEARKLALKDGWFAALQAVVVLEDSPLKDPNQIPLPNLPTVAQKTPVVADKEETTSLRELVEQIDAHAEPIDLEATSNPNAKDQHSGNVQPPPRPSMLLWIPPRFNSWTLPLNPWIRFLFLTFILCSPNTLSFKSLPMSPGCGDRTTILVSVKFPEVVGFWRRNIGFNYICFI